MKPKVHLWSYLVIFFSDLQNIRQNFINHNRHFVLNDYFISKSWLLGNYVEKYRRVRPVTDDFNTCSLHGGNLRLQHALRVCNIYWCPAATNVVRTIVIVTVYVHWLSCGKWVVSKHGGTTGAILSWYRLPILVWGRSAVCFWHICNSYRQHLHWKHSDTHLLRSCYRPNVRFNSKWR